MKEKKIKILWSLVVVVVISMLLIVGGSRICYAIGGVCSGCHTMHNSQDGATEVQIFSSGTLAATTTPQDQLLKASCIACHTGSGTGATNSDGAPIVLHIQDPVTQGAGQTLAGGDFHWVADDLGTADHTMGHNVVGISVVDNPISYEPPGFDSGATPGALAGDGQIAGGSWGSNQLTCAGKYGCHGNHTDTDPDTAIAGAHHGNTGGTSSVVTTQTTVGASYRFLGGIKGREETSWNWAESATVHNEYFGAATPSATYGSKDTISYSCAQCHGTFHDSDTIGGTSSPWVRHPTDLSLPTSGEYASYLTYSTEAPVARTDISSMGQTVTPTGAVNDIVMCLSCHRAHGSPEPDLLRWTYSGMVAGSSANANTGCFTCHTTKDDG